MDRQDQANLCDFSKSPRDRHVACLGLMGVPEVHPEGSHHEEIPLLQTPLTNRFGLLFLRLLCKFEELIHHCSLQSHTITYPDKV